MSHAKPATSTRILVSHQYRLAVSLVPKCGSTSMIKLILDVHGQASVADPYRFLAEISTQDLSQANLQHLSVNAANARDTYRQLSNYRWLSVARCPYSRFLSNRGNKLNRLTKKFCKLDHLLSKLALYRQGPGGWSDQRHALKFLQSRVSIDQTLAILERVGVEFDEHYRTQHSLLMPEAIHYDRIVQLERLQCDLKDYFSSIGLRNAFVPSIDRLPVLNPSASRTAVAALSPEQLSRIYRIYRDDFERLGYAAKPVLQPPSPQRAA